MSKMLTPRQLTIKIIISLLILAAVMSFCALAGSQKIDLQKVLAGAGAAPGENTDYEIFVAVRVPRVILAALVGAALACSGCALQALLRNPLADPYILGISSGAGMGVMAAVLSGITWTLWGCSSITVFAFIGALLTVWLVWFIAYLAGKSQTTVLLLAGVIVNALFSAVIMFLTSIAKSEQVHSTIFWLMGNITEKSSSVLWASGIFCLAGTAGLFTISNRLNILTFGDEQAKTLGIDTVKTKLIAFGIAAFVTAVAVSLSGLIGFVGLIIPHAVRLLFGPDHRQLLPLSAIIGGAFLVVADTIARMVVAPAQLPVGVITAIAGGPLFLVLLANKSRKVNWLK